MKKIDEFIVAVDGPMETVEGPVQEVKFQFVDGFTYAEDVDFEGEFDKDSVFCRDKTDMVYLNAVSEYIKHRQGPDVQNMLCSDAFPLISLAGKDLRGFWVGGKFMKYSQVG